MNKYLAGPNHRFLWDPAASSGIDRPSAFGWRVLTIGVRIRTREPFLSFGERLLATLCSR